MPSEFSIVQKAENKQCLYELMGYTKKEYLRRVDELAYLRKHGLSTRAQDLRKRNVQFSQKFFEVIDYEDNDGISDEEFAYPLIALGLATDMSFVQRMMRILAPKKFKTKEDFKSESLTLKEFSTLMADDVVGDRVVKIIQAEALARRAEAQASKKKAA